MGKNCTILENVILGYPSSKVLDDARSRNIKLERYPYAGTTIGDNAVIRSNSTIYCDVKIGNNLRTGHNIMVREMTTLGDNVLIGTNTIIDGYSIIGNSVSMQSNVYVPLNTIIEDNVFMGPCSVLTNDKYPIRVKYDLKGPVLRTGASIGANATILPGVEVGEGAMVGAGAVVTKNVPPWMLAIGAPAKIVKLPENLRNLNKI
ncbi:MAG TPA: acyltransferase [Methanocella sp.]|uniref:acyltransferase n=1 Tax=Methanocella sp. TaxID=2052833 RepID=UPI002C7EAB67|nr:acyltransferase [Methanocella sp.]HTY90752.1 acyltransferase [Methanocella sp.]